MTNQARPESLRILVSAGEASADRCAADVLKRLKGIVPSMQVRGLGGAALAEVGMDLDFDLRRTTSMGGVEVAARFPQIVRTWFGLIRLARRWRPDIVLAVDLPDFNIPLSRRFRKLGIPVLGYVAPQFWAWRPGRLRKLSQSFTHLACLLPFEKGPLQNAGVPSTFVGHPLLDSTPPSRDQARGALGLESGRSCLALLPGSRPSEIGRHLELMLGAAAAVRRRRDTAVLLAVAPSIRPTIAVPSWCRVVTTSEHPQPGACVLAAADFALVASGSATLEAALAEVPMIAVCRLNLSTYFMARTVVRCRYFALSNVLLGRRAFPELLQGAVTAGSMADYALYALNNPSFAQHQSEATRELRSLLAGPGASSTTAKLLAELAKSR